MTLLNVTCPICETVCQVSDANSGTAAKTRCGYCGWLFARRLAGSETVKVEPPPVRVGSTGRIPSPPVVIYRSSARSVPAFGAPASGGLFDRGQVEQRFAGGFEGEPSSSSLNRGDGTSGSTAGGLSGPLGSPPPYRPVQAPPKPVRARPPAPDAARSPPVNARVVSALGPPPPYRPIAQPDPVFGRGPAPDLEPWRQGAPIRMPPPDSWRGAPFPLDNAGLTEETWDLARDAEPLVSATPEREPETRLEPLPNFGPNDRPVAWPKGAPAPTGVIASRRPRSMRRRVLLPVVWAVGIVSIVLLAGVALDRERAVVMRTFPETARIYAAVGLAGKPPAARTACDEAAMAGRSGAGLQEAGCPEGQVPDGTFTGGTVTDGQVTGEPK
jgi:hypothetical protein